jgi:hypothetical protein
MAVPRPGTPFRLWFGALLVVFAAALVGRPAVAEEGAAEEPNPPARCDRVVLTNGRTIEGWVLREEPKKIVLGLVSQSGGSGRMEIPRDRIREIQRGSDRAPPLGEGTVRDTWYLLRSGARTAGVRRVALRRVRAGETSGWRLEERVTWFGRGPSAPSTKIDRVEVVDLAFQPLSLEFHEVGEGSLEPGGPARYERHVVGKVVDGTFTARVATGAEVGEASVHLPTRTRGRLATREDLLRRRTAGIEPIAFLDAAQQAIVTARAGYTVLDQPDGQGGRHDEFVWEEDGRRLVTRNGPDGPISEEVAEGIVAVPVSEAQAKAAVAESSGVPEAAAASGAAEKPAETTFSEAGVALTAPSAAWKVERAVVSATDAGPRLVAKMANPVHMADVRVEWDPDGVLAAPRPEEAEIRLLQRLRTVCPDLAVVEARASVPGVPGAWRLGLVGTLRGERVRTIALAVDRPPARVVVLLACPEVAWGSARPSLEQVVASLRTL